MSGDHDALLAENVVFRYFKNGKRNILDHTNFRVREHTITVLMGKSGCGKSTLAAASCGLLPEDGGVLEEGRILLFGRDIHDMSISGRAQEASMMFQNPDLQFCMNTLRDEGRFCLGNLSVRPEEMDRRIEEAAERLEMTSFLDRNFHSLSGGEKQKAVLTCLFLMNSRLLILDEPFANLDPVSAGEIVGMLRHVKEAGRTILVIDHRADYWLQDADEIQILTDGGKVAADGITKDNIASYAALFEKEGVFCPAVETHQIRSPEKSTQGDIAIRMTNLSVPRNKTKKDAEPLFTSGDFRLAKGSVTALLGRSGCGKTSLLLTLLKEHVYSGTIIINDRMLDQVKKKDLYRETGIVFQNPSDQFVTQNVEEEVLASLRWWDKSLSDDTLRSRSGELLAAFGLEKYRRYSPYMLSQGQQRRLAVIAALSGGQRILLLDEPTYGQDHDATYAVMKAICKKAEQEGLTVLFTTHDTALANEFAENVWVIRNRRLMELPAGSVSPADLIREEEA